jgi:signal transduction histidine kinase
MPSNLKSVHAVLGAMTFWGKRPKLQISIRWMVFAGLILASVPAVLGLYIWMERHAIQKEVDYVDENHLIIAKNLAAAMERYAIDVATVFELAAKNMQEPEGIDLSETLDEFDLRFVTILDIRNDIVSEVSAASVVSSELPSTAQLANLRAQAFASPNQTVFSGILLSNGAPHIFLTRILDDGKLVISALQLRYLIDLQSSIKFGDLGHSMIVDQNGLVIAHPNAEWQANSKDASMLSVVQQMMAGETGVAQFYSPPMQADMISGFTFVARTGWGVMVPQPIGELVARAKSSQSTALTIVLVEVIFIIGLSWWASRLISTPVLNVVDTAAKISSGDYSARVKMEDTAIRVSEAEILGASFNQLISDLQTDRNQLTSALDAALEGERAKSRFLAVMSHEVRTPMHGLMGILELIEDGELNDGQRHLLTVGQKAAKNMASLVDDVLHFVRLETNAESCTIVNFDPSELAQSAVDLFHPIASQKGLSIDTTVSDQMQLGDPQLISQILLNLVGNAVKFTDEGKIHIGSEFRSGENGTDQFVFSVTDSGIGIAKDFHEKIFAEFSQVDSEFTRTNGGSGLGLAISSRLAALMGGEIIVSSELKEGSCFQLVIPIPLVGV